MVSIGETQSREVRGLRGREAEPINWKSKYLENPLGATLGPGVADGVAAEANDVVSACESQAVLVNEDTSATVEAKREPQKRCASHRDGDWLREPIPGRPGWERASCRQCGVTIGCNPIQRMRHSSPDSGLIESGNKGSTTRTGLVDGEITSGPQVASEEKDDLAGDKGNVFDSPIQTAVKHDAAPAMRNRRLVITTPATFPDNLMDAIQGFRDDIVEAWAERAAVREFDGNHERHEAESLASKDLVALDFVSCNRTDSRTS
jgi:hypothetical protein